MPQSPLVWWRRVLIVACLLALLPTLSRAADVRSALQRDRLAADAFNRGLQLAAVGRRADALDALRTAAANAPADADLHELIALAQFRLGRIDDAVATYRRILRVYPYTYAGALYRGVGLIELRAGRAAAARDDLLRAVELDPQDWLAYHLLGHARKRTGDLAGARAAWERVLELRPEFQPARDQLRALGGTR